MICNNADIWTNPKNPTRPVSSSAADPIEKTHTPGHSDPVCLIFPSSTKRNCARVLRQRWSKLIKRVCLLIFISFNVLLTLYLGSSWNLCIFCFSFYWLKMDWSTVLFLVSRFIDLLSPSMFFVLLEFGFKLKSLFFCFSFWWWNMDFRVLFSLLVFKTVIFLPLF